MSYKLLDEPKAREALDHIRRTGKYRYTGLLVKKTMVRKQIRLLAWPSTKKVGEFAHCQPHQAAAGALWATARRGAPDEECLRLAENSAHCACRSEVRMSQSQRTLQKPAWHITDFNTRYDEILEREDST
jgi:hypothetical protein